MGHKCLCLTIISILLSLIYFQVITLLFENDRHFSHLSPVEREMSLRTEMAFYYNYFKRIADPSDQIHTNLTHVSVYHSIRTILNDNLTEFPNTINALKKFNIYPEVIIGLNYRIFAYFLNLFDLSPLKECYLVSRGADLSPVESCEGLSEPIYFYIYSVFAFNSLVFGFLFLNSYIISDNIFGTIITLMMFAYNHKNCTRIQWTPPLRESFGYPVYLILQTYVNYLVADSKRPLNRMLVISLMVCLLLCWQFSPFLLLSQLICLFLTFKCLLINSYTKYRSTFIQLVNCNFYSVVLAFVLMFFNTYLINSLHFHFIISNIVYEYLIASYEKNICDKLCPKRFETIGGKTMVTIAINSCFVFTLTLVSKVLIAFISGNRDDSHVWLILLSKITSYRDFHTMLYTCSPEFDFMSFEELSSLCQTLLLPVAVVATVLSLVKSPNSAVIQLNAIQSLLFMAMSLMIMRLKLLFVPQLCLMSALCAVVVGHRGTGPSNWCLIALLVAISSYSGLNNIHNELDIIGEYFNEPLEQVIQFIVSSTHPNSVFAGIPLRTSH